MFKNIIFLVFTIVLAFIIGSNFIIGNGPDSLENQGKKIIQHSDNIIDANLPSSNLTNP